MEALRSSSAGSKLRSESATRPWRVPPGAPSSHWRPRISDIVLIYLLGFRDSSQSLRCALRVFCNHSNTAKLEISSVLVLRVSTRRPKPSKARPRGAFSQLSRRTQARGRLGREGKKGHHKGHGLKDKFPSLLSQQARQQAYLADTAAGRMERVEWFKALPPPEKGLQREEACELSYRVCISPVHGCTTRKPFEPTDHLLVT